MNMNEKPREPYSWKQAIRFMFFAVTLALPFVLQKSHLDVTRGGWRPELANFASHLVPFSFLLPLVAIFFLPLAWQGRLALAVVLMPIFIFAFGYFTVDYACNNYNGYCF
jgi:VIT1/CCC1 family predicted Fe2+/Mn2+ transporter